MIIWEGPSEIDGGPIVVIAVGTVRSKANTKTGEMVQTYILRSDMGPFAAVQAGADRSICGDCRHRGDGTGKERSCYVTLIHGPRVIAVVGREANLVMYDAFEAVVGREADHENEVDLDLWNAAWNFAKDKYLTSWEHFQG